MVNNVTQKIRGYELNELIGTGGFGVVYRAYQPAVDREVAIKAILPVHANDPDFVRRFEREARFIARLEHLHIIPIYDYWRDPRGAYLVMRYLRGGNLQTSVQKDGPWSLADTVRFVEQIAAALSVAHQSGIVHQDIKPENILLDEQRNAYLSDFGIAKDIVTPSNEPPDRYGSPGYAAPEQITGQPITPQSDIYSLSLVAYAVLTGYAPFEDTSTVHLIRKTLQEQLPAISEKRPDLPRDLDYVLRRGAAKDPGFRYPDPLSFAGDFRRCSLLHTDSETMIPRPIEVTIGAGTIPLSPYSTQPLDLGTQPLVNLARNPYKGLRAFDEADMGDFFGREALVAALIKRLSQYGPYSRFLAVVGPSGSGKSSVVRAGLIPVLRRGVVAGSERWFITTMTPGEHPLQDLEEALLRVAFDPPRSSLVDMMRQSEAGLYDALKTLFPADASEVFLVIDQFEEVFSPVVSEDERLHFLNNLLHVLQQRDSHLQVLITLRADFYDRPLLHPGFGNFMRERTAVVLPLDAEELHQAVIKPAQSANLLLDEGLADRIVEEVRAQPGALPLLQFALTELYERREGLQLTNAAYTAIGGVSGALVKRADELFEGLYASHKLIARQIFLRLVTLGEGVEDTRRRVLQHELLSIGDNRAVAQEVMNLFGQYRLLTFDRDPATRAPTVEIAHEALIRQWGKLREWLETNRDDLRLQMRLGGATAEWLNAGRDPSYLATGARLTQFETLLNHTSVALTADERRYLHDSVAMRQRTILRQQLFIAGLIVTTLIAVGLALFAADRQNRALIERDRADVQAQISRSRELAMAASADRSRLDDRLRLSLQALDSYDTRQARSSLLTNLQSNPRLVAFLPGHVGEVRAAAISPDGKLIATGGDYAAIILYDGETLEMIGEPLRGHSGTIWSLAFSPDGQTLASAGREGVIRLWDVATGEMSPLSDAPLGEIWSIAFSPDGQTLASGGVDRIVRLWALDSDTPESIDLGGHTDTVFSVAFSPDGRYLATGDGAEQIRLWNLADLEDVSVLEGQRNWVLTLAFNRDSSLLASSGPDRDVILWDVAARAEIARFGTGHTDWVRQVAFSPLGNILATASQDNTMRLWDLNTGQLIGPPYTGHTNAVWDVAFTPDGSHLITTSSDGSAMVWRVNANNPLASLFASDLQGVWDIAVSPNQEWLVAGTGAPGERAGAAVRLWRLSDPSADSVVFDSFAGLVSRLAFSADGRWLAVGSEDTTVHLLDLSGEQPEEVAVLRQNASVTGIAFQPGSGMLAVSSAEGPVRLYPMSERWDTPPQEIPVQVSSSTRLAFSPDGQQLAVGYLDGRVILWDVASRTQQGAMSSAHNAQVEAVAFSPDGRWLASAGRDNQVLVWDAAQRELVFPPLRYHTNWVMDVAFSPDGQTLASASRDNSVVLWDMQSGEVIGVPLLAHLSWATAVEFADEGRSLVSGGWDGQIMRWDMRLQSWENLACAVINPLQGEASDVCPNN